MSLGYTFGINWRAIVAYLVGIGINFAGFLHAMGAIELNVGTQRSFYFAFITSGCGAGLTYYLLARFFPQPNYVANKGLKFKEWSQEEVEQYAPVDDASPAASAAGTDGWRAGNELEKEDEATDVRVYHA